MPEQQLLPAVRRQSISNIHDRWFFFGECASNDVELQPFFLIIRTLEIILLSIPHGNEFHWKKISTENYISPEFTVSLEQTTERLLVLVRSFCWIQERRRSMANFDLHKYAMLMNRCRIYVIQSFRIVMPKQEGKKALRNSSIKHQTWWERGEKLGKFKIPIIEFL